jgi:predicted AlkP superfamily phosphohydrolase/phosphomutase
VLDLKKVYLVGLDSVPLWILEKLPDTKEFENIHRIMKKGKIKDLLTTMMPVTNAAWGAIYTGLSESELGIYDFLILNKDYKLDLVEYDNVAYPPIWESLNLKSLVITPATYVEVSRKSNVDMISGFPYPYNTNNQKLKLLMKKYNFYQEAAVEKDVESRKISPEEAAKLFVDKIRIRREIASEMLSENEYDFVFICITETDRIQHFTLSRDNYMDYQLPIFAEIDKLLKYILERIEREDGTLLLVSDHGGQAVHKKFLINSWLIQNGYAKLKDENKNVVLATSITNNEMVRKIYDKMPKVIKKKVISSGIADTSFKPLDLDMKNTVAFSATSTDAIVPIWINDSRFAEGSNANLKFKEKLMEDLKKIDMIENVLDGKKYYGNTNKFIVPDILLEAKGGYSIKTNEIDTELIKELNVNRGGDHTKYGIIGAYPNILENKDYNVKEVASIIKKLYGKKK